MLRGGTEVSPALALVGEGRVCVCTVPSVSPEVLVKQASLVNALLI